MKPKLQALALKLRRIVSNWRFWLLVLLIPFTVLQVYNTHRINLIADKLGVDKSPPPVKQTGKKR